MHQKIDIFLSYAHDDKALQDNLMKHLSTLISEDSINIRNDQDIPAGAEWQQGVDTYLINAQLILLLVSPSFMASKYMETKQAVQRHETGKARVIPIILRPTDWQTSPFGKLQVLPRNAEPITKWTNQDEAFLTVAQEIRKAVDELILKEVSVEPVETMNVVTTYKGPDIPVFKVGQEIKGMVMPLTEELRQIVPPNTKACLRYQPRSIQNLLIVVDSEEAKEWSTGQTHICLFVKESTFRDYTILYCHAQPNDLSKSLPHATHNSLLTRARQEQSLSIKKLAENLDMPINIIKGWEDGTIIPSNYFVKRICVFFGKSAKDLGFDNHYTQDDGPISSEPIYDYGHGECQMECA